jgi:hypothetical protein
MRSLPPEVQRAHELVTALHQDHAGLCDELLGHVGAAHPPSLGALEDLVARLKELDMALDQRGIARFKALRGLSGGLSLAGVTARAYAVAMRGREVLFDIDRAREANLRPSERGALAFLRHYAVSHGWPAIHKLKEALDMGNPPQSAAAEKLHNEYIGLNTVEVLAQTSAARGLPLSHAGMVELCAKRPNKT